MNESWTKSWTSVHVIAEMQPKKKKHTFKVISIVRTCVPLLCVKNTKVTIVAWEYPGAQSDPVSRLLEVWDCRKKDLKTSVSGHENASCHVESFGLWGWGVFWVAPGGGSAAVRRSGVWLCKWWSPRGSGPPGCPLSHTASWGLNIKVWSQWDKEKKLHLRQLEGKCSAQNLLYQNLIQVLMYEWHLRLWSDGGCVNFYIRTQNKMRKLNKKKFKVYSRSIKNML